MLNNVKNLHIVLNKDAAEIMADIDPLLLKVKYPGEHTAIIREEYLDEMKGLNLFHEIITLDVNFLQRCSFSPLLGDASAFKFMCQKLKPLTNEKWSRIFNIKSCPLNSSFSTLFTANTRIGAYSNEGKFVCHESPLKLNLISSNWGMENSYLRKVLNQKSLHQLDMDKIEKEISRIADLKTKTNDKFMKGAVVAVNISECSESVLNNLKFMNQLFSLVPMNEFSKMTLESFVNVANPIVDSINPFYFDLVVNNQSRKNYFLNNEINIEGQTTEELTEVISEILPSNFTKWSTLSFLFDYLGNPKLALSCEKIFTKYDKKSVQPFLYNEILQLKEFAKILLEGIRRNVKGDISYLENYWATKPSTLSYVSCIELSMKSPIKPLLSGESDLLAIKLRMKNLNYFYERVYRACTIDIPKSDLALTL
ncbi:MAG: hypothetical protein K2P81_04890 [Bacteriovoracaceae bacterium]|nr:hypothetical protein [Bacteriovoracaceae bacterium]